MNLFTFLAVCLSVSVSAISDDDKLVANVLERLSQGLFPYNKRVTQWMGKSDPMKRLQLFADWWKLERSCWSLFSHSSNLD